MGDRGLASGIFNSVFTLGTGLAAPLLTGLMLLFGWRRMFIIMGLVGLLTAALWYALYRELSVRADGRREPLHVSVAHIGLAAAIPYIFAVAGGLTGGVARGPAARARAGAHRQSQIPLCAAMLSEAVFVVIATLAPSNAVAIACLSGAMFCGTVATTNAWALVSAGPANCTGSLGAMQNFGGHLSGALAPTVRGFIVQWPGSFVPALLIGAGMALFAGVAY